MTGTPGNSNDTRDELREEISKVRLALLHARIDSLEASNKKRETDTSDEIKDIDKRLRPAEEMVIKFNFIMYLTMGGGLVGLINLAILVYILVKAMTP